MPSFNDLKLSHVEPLLAAGAKAAAEQHSESALVHGLLDILTVNKGAGDIINYFRDNRNNILELTSLVRGHPDGLNAVLDMGATPKGRAELMGKLPDKASQDALDFLVKNRAQIGSMQKVMATNPFIIDDAINFMANHANELADMAKFTAAHPHEMGILADKAMKADASVSFMGLLRDPSLWKFEATNGKELMRMKNFLSTNSFELPLIMPDEMQEIQKIGDFALANKNEIAALSQTNVANFKKGLGDLVEIKDEEVRRYRGQMHEARDIADETASQLAILQKTDPTFYKAALQLQRESIAITHKAKFDANGKLISETPSFQKAANDWEMRSEALEAKILQAHPEMKEHAARSLPVIMPREFLYNPCLEDVIKPLIGEDPGVSGTSAPAKPRPPSSPRSSM